MHINKCKGLAFLYEKMKNKGRKSVKARTIDRHALTTNYTMREHMRWPYS